MEKGILRSIVYAGIVFCFRTHAHWLKMQDYIFPAKKACIVTSSVYDISNSSLNFVISAKFQIIQSWGIAIFHGQSTF